MATTRYRLPVGVSAAIPVNPLTSVYLGPVALAGTVLIEFSLDGRTRWMPWIYSTAAQISGGSFRPLGFGYVRATVGVSPANLFVVDMTGANTPNVTQLANITDSLASGSSTAEQLLFGIRLPERYLPPVFTLQIALAVSVTNNANVKTLRVRWNGVAGTALFTSPSLASVLNYNAQLFITGRGDGRTLLGGGPGASGGIGTSAVAYVTGDFDYINQESDLVVTATKATAGDAMVLEALMAELF